MIILLLEEIQAVKKVFRQIMNFKSVNFYLCFIMFLCQYSFAQIRPSFSGFTNTHLGSNTENAYLFDPAAVSGNSATWPGEVSNKLYANDFGGLSNTEFIDYALNLMKDTSSNDFLFSIHLSSGESRLASFFCGSSVKQIVLGTLLWFWLAK